MQVNIEDLEFECIIGILDFERETPQKVIIDLSYSYHFKNSFIDYAEIVSHVKKLMIEKKYQLIEDAVLEISNFLQQNFPSIESLNIKISKPSILPDCRVSVAFVS
ncbi:MAG: dihydroneopterin aldolase [Epsilonproteobacteria bacterium]|nr:dihydroneopterin aldolase [Campylobacterota bacterium]